MSPKFHIQNCRFCDNFFLHIYKVFWRFFSTIFFISHGQICFFLMVDPPSFGSPSFILGPSTLRGRAPSRSGLPLKNKNHQFTWRSLTFSVCLLFHVDGQLCFTVTVLDGNILIIPVNCRCSTLSSIISDSFEFLLAALTHKFHKSEKNNAGFFFPPSPPGEQ